MCGIGGPSYSLLTLLLSFPLAAVPHIAVLNAVDNGLGADGEVIEGLLDVQRQCSNLKAHVESEL